MDSMNKKEGSLLRVVYGDFSLGVKGEKNGKKFEYIFHYGRGGMESMVVEGKEWLYRVPHPVFWRALTDNDRGCGFHLKSGMWLAADMFIKNTGAKVKVDGKETEGVGAPGNNRFSGNETAAQIEVEFEYETITVPATKVSISYCVEGDGSITVKEHFYGKEGLPELPVFGMRFLMPTAADGFIYEGLSGETYPDRLAGGVKGVYKVKGMPVTPYLVPQDCGMHMDTKWVEVYRTSVLDNRKTEPVQTALKFESIGEKPFAFSCLPCTAQELENALHIEELPPFHRTVLCIYGAVRGVGGIDSWGAEPESEYHVSAQRDWELKFRISIADGNRSMDESGNK